MKKMTRKLALSRETLRNLNAEQLHNVDGGALQSTQYSVCDQSCGIACTVRNLTCTCTAE